MCPDTPGDALANGCPDFDKDGIPNKYDLCPHLFGLAKLQGCPDLSSDEDAILTKALGDLKFDFDQKIDPLHGMGWKIVEIGSKL